MTAIDAHGQSSTAGGLVARVRGAAATELARRLGPARLFTPSEDDQALVWSVIAERLADAHRDHVLAGGVPLDDPARQGLAQQVFDALLGLGPLERYLAHPEVEELLVNAHQQGFVLRAGGTKERVSTGFGSEAELRAFAARTVGVAGRRLDEANPKADARLPDGSRLHAICPPLTPFTCLTIRRHRLLAHTIQDLLALGTLTREVAGLLQAAVRAGLNLLISGGTGSGKTTTLNAIASQIPAGQRVITIEETKELALERHLEDCIALEGRFANLEGVGEIRIRELVRQALRMRPVRIIVGEVRGPEALDMLNAMNSGHEGSMGTIHANSARQALTKLHTYTKMAEEALSDGVVADMIAQTIDLVCQLRLGPDGRRVLTEVVEVAGVEAGRLLANHLVQPNPDGIPTLTGLRPQAVERLREAGWAPPSPSADLLTLDGSVTGDRPHAGCGGRARSTPPLLGPHAPHRDPARPGPAPSADRGGGGRVVGRGWGVAGVRLAGAHLGRPGRRAAGSPLVGPSGADRCVGQPQRSHRRGRRRAAGRGPGRPRGHRCPGRPGPLGTCGAAARPRSAGHRRGHSWPPPGSGGLRAAAGRPTGRCAGGHPGPQPPPGGRNLSEVLDDLAAAINAEAHTLREVRARQAQQRLSARLVAAAPLVILVAIRQTNPAYLAPFDTPTGQVILALALLLIVAGYGAMVRLARPPAGTRLLPANPAAGGGRP